MDSNRLSNTCDKAGGIGGISGRHRSAISQLNIAPIAAAAARPDVWSTCEYVLAVV